MVPPHLVIRLFLYTVELRSKGPATKGNRSLWDNGAQSRFSPFSFLLFRIPARWDTAIRETPAFGKESLVPPSIFPRLERFFLFEEEDDVDDDKGIQLRLVK